MVPLIVLTLFSSASTACPDGWITFRTSCYFIGWNDVPYVEALSVCYGNESSLFVPNSADEWETIRAFAQPGYWSWLGLYEHRAEDLPTWILRDGIDVHSLPWLNTHLPSSYGHRPHRNCVAYFATFDRQFQQYDVVHWHNCDTYRGFICERNMTAVNLAVKRSKIQLRHGFMDY